MIIASSVRPRASVLIPAYKRDEGLRRLLGLLETQTVSADTFEVIVVDDGSPNPLMADALQTSYALTVLHQQNSGPAAARHRAAEEARGEVLIIIDDDMQIGAGFVAGHLRVHEAGTRRAALGPVEPDPNVRELSLFEQWNADRLHRVAQDAAAGAVVRGNNLWAGNASFRRDDYFAVGGFDPALRLSEDLELGMRLEESGVEITFAFDAGAVHRSDHSNDTWFRRASACAAADKVVFRKHPEAVHADPWRYFYQLPRPVRPLFGLATAFPSLSGVLARTLVFGGECALRFGARKIALKCAAVAYAVEYFHGLRLEEGSRAACVTARRDYLAQVARFPVLPDGVPRRRAHWERMKADLRTDTVTRERNEAKYGYAGERSRGALSTFVQKIGVQTMTAIRFMTFCRDAGFPIGARIMSRLIRHLYGSDVHWDASWGPGTTLVHAFGLAISGAARVGPECIVFQNVCLGMGIDPETRVSGAPTLGRGVHVGPGAALLGPITVGEGTKVMAGAVLTQSVPAWSLVETPSPTIRPRKAGADHGAAGDHRDVSVVNGLEFPRR